MVSTCHIFYLYILLKVLLFNAYVISTSQELHSWFMLCCVLLWFGGFQFYPCSSGLLHWHWGNHMIAPVPVKQPWRIWINISHKSSNKYDITKQSTTKQTCLMGYTADALLHFYVAAKHKQTKSEGVWMTVLFLIIIAIYRVSLICDLTCVTVRVQCSTVKYLGWLS